MPRLLEGWHIIRSGGGGNLQQLAPLCAARALCLAGVAGVKVMSPTPLEPDTRAIYHLHGHEELCSDA